MRRRAYSIVFGNLLDNDQIQGFFWCDDVSFTWQNVYRISLERHRTAKAAGVRPNNYEAEIVSKF